MSRFRLIAALTAAAAVAGCTHYGTTRVDQGETAPTGLYFVHTPAQARVSVDGTDFGAAGAFTGSKKDILPIASGSHRITVTLGAQVIFDKPVYVGSGDRVRIEPQ
jgi:hypothetical protein